MTIDDYDILVDIKTKYKLPGGGSHLISNLCSLIDLDCKKILKNYQ